MRLYEAQQRSPNRSGPSRVALDLATAAGRRLIVDTHANFGGEVGGDRPASQLPTSSGRFGPDIALTLKYFVEPRAGLLATYEEAAYRSASGNFAYRDHVLIVGIFVRP